jgi:hypothetical protein
MFLLGFPYGLLEKIYIVEDYKTGHYTIWDRIRYWLYSGQKL